MGQKVKLERDTGRMLKRDFLLFFRKCVGNMWRNYTGRSWGLIGNWQGWGVGVLSSSGGRRRTLGVGEVWVKELASDGAGRKGEWSEDAGSRVWRAGLGPAPPLAGRQLLRHVLVRVHATR